MLDLDHINPLSPPSDPVQRQLQSPPAKNKFLAVKSKFLAVRVTQKTGSVSLKDLRRFARRGMKGLRRQSLKLSRK